MLGPGGCVAAPVVDDDYRVIELSLTGNALEPSPQEGPQEPNAGYQVELDARLGPRVPHSQDVLTLPEGNEITVRRADARDLEAAKAMHERCSARTLGMRYHGPVGDADRYLSHLLSPRFGYSFI